MDVANPVTANRYPCAMACIDHLHPMPPPKTGVIFDRARGYATSGRRLSTTRIDCNGARTPAAEDFTKPARKPTSRSDSFRSDFLRSVLSEQFRTETKQSEAEMILNVPRRRDR